MTLGRKDNISSRLAARLLVITTLCMLLTMGAANGQSYVEVFGQNRIQNRKFQWKYFDTKHFRVYHYDKAGRDLGRYVSEEAENDISVVEKKLGGQFPPRFNIILYNTYEEYRQTNVGLRDESALNGNSRAGTINLVGDKLVVYFNGQHTDLSRQIRNGMARVVMQRMIFGDNFKKMVKNALLLNLPEWVTEGYIAYLVDGWDVKSNSDWKSLLDARTRAGFYQLAEEYPELAGKAFWKFVSSQYGAGTVKSLLYSMQQKTSLNKAMKEKAGLNMKVTKAYDSCIKFYKGVYLADAEKQEKPDSTKGLISLKVPKDNTIVRNIKLSPRGSDVSYVAWKEGKYTVYTQRTGGEQEASVLLEGGQKDLTDQIDPSYPMMAWSNTGYKLAILYKKGTQNNLKIYNSVKGSIENYVIPDNRFDRVLGMTFPEDDDKLIFSAIKKSQTDLFYFTFKGTKMTNITDDSWDDISPVFVSGGSRTGILFLSNRPKPGMNVPVGVNELPNKSMNIFFYNTKTQRKELLQCTDIATGTITQPIQYGFDNFAYLYDGNGINNKYVVMFARNKKNMDSAYSVPITNYSTSILSHQYNIASGEVADVVQEKDKYRVYFHELQMPGQNTQVKTLLPTTLSIEKPEPKTERKIISQQPGDTVYSDEPDAPVVKSGNVFQSEFSDTMPAPKRKNKNKATNIFNRGAASAAPDSSQLKEMTDSAYVKMKPSPYRGSFKPESMQVKLDNSVLFTQYQAISSNGGQFQTPSLGALTTISLNELMENHKITGGLRIPVSLENPSPVYFVQYQNFTRRLDWGLVFMRTQNKSLQNVAYEDNNHNIVLIRPQLFKSVTNLLQADFSYPLDRVRAVKFHTGLRQDRLVEKSTDTLSLSYPVPASNKFTSVSRLEYVFDNTIMPALNIFNGTRFKVYTEYMGGLNKQKLSCYNIGLDFRNYQKIYKNFILANRFAYAHSDGNSQVEYVLGGVDNWILPFDPEKRRGPLGNQSPDARYGFQAMETTVRGYKQYARIGNSFAIFNTELRLPLVTTFVKRPIKSAILKNLQLICFADAGDAWVGLLPNADVSKLQQYVYPNQNSPSSGLNNVQMTIIVPGSGGMAFGYGAGLRTSLFGYFMRLDVATNIDGDRPMYYVSMGTDF
ncbi:MAG: hypothetical protein JWQ38_1070 [Flavipsychrobacter sp.]|nr:hypothetical protein [Flavipsychrobacter sp.]